MTNTLLCCPWCKRTDITSLPLLKRHVKYCSFAPRPRGKQRLKDSQQGSLEDLFGLPASARAVKKERENDE